MILFGLISSLTDIILPLFQRYALDHFIGLGVFDTIAMFLVLYILTILVGAVVVMVVLDPGLAAMVLSILPLLVILFAIFQKKLIKVNREVREVNSRITGNFDEGITGAKTIKSLAIEKKMERRFNEETNNMRTKSVQASRLRGLFAGTINLASSVALAIVLWKGGYIATEQIGTFSVFMSYAQGMMEPLRWWISWRI